MTEGPEHHQKVKHIARRHFFVRECVENMQIIVPYVESSDNLADFLTKPLEGKTFFRLRDRIMNVYSPMGGYDASTGTRAWGGVKDRSGPGVSSKLVRGG